MRDSFHITEDDFSTAWDLLSAEEKTQLREDYRALLGQRLRTAIYESGPLHEVAQEVGEARPRARTGFRRSLVVPGAVQVTHALLSPPTKHGALCDGTVSTCPSDAATSVRASETAASQSSHLLELLTSILFDEETEAGDGGADNARHDATAVRLLPRAGGGAKGNAARKTEEAGDYYRLLVAHAKRVKAEAAAEELERASRLPSLGPSTVSCGSMSGAATSQGSPLTVKQGAVLYNDGPTDINASESDHQWVPRKFVAATAAMTTSTTTTRTKRGQDGSDVDTAPPPTPPPPPAQSTRPSVTETGLQHLHTAASFTLSSTLGSLLSYDSSSTATKTNAGVSDTQSVSTAQRHGDGDAEVAMSLRCGMATGHHSKPTSRGPTLKDRHKADNEVAVQNTSAEADDAATRSPPTDSGNVFSTFSARATHRLKAQRMLHRESTDLAATACTSNNVAPKLSETQLQMKRMPSALFNPAARYHVLHQTPLTESHTTHSHSVETRPSGRRSSIDKAIDELFPDSIDF